MNLFDRRELNNGVGNALSRAVELTVTPLIFGFFGWLLDGRLGTRPVFMFLFFAFVLGYTLWKEYVLYGKAMDEEQAKLFGVPGERAPASRTEMGSGGAAPEGSAKLFGRRGEDGKA